MGQYHLLVNRDAGQHVMPHTLGSGLKAWEQTAGAVPAAKPGKGTGLSSDTQSAADGGVKPRILLPQRARSKKRK